MAEQRRAKLRLSYGEKSKDSEWVRVYPQHDDNWQAEAEGFEPISLEVKYLGPKAATQYQERLAMLAQTLKKNDPRRDERIWKIHKDRLGSCIRDGSIRGVEDANGKAITSVDEFLEHPIVPSELIGEILEIVTDLAMLKQLTAEEYEAYKADRKEDGASDREVERELLEKDEAGN